MIEYLEKLMDNKEFEKALAYADQLLSNRDSDTVELAMIHRAILNGRLHLADYTGAVTAGEIAVRLARETYQWDCFGAACMDLGTAYFYLRDWNQAIGSWLHFLTALACYRACSQFEASVRYNLGLAQTANGDYAEACHSMEQALMVANSVRHERLAHGIRLALVESLLKAGNLTSIARLLAQCGRYIRTSRVDSQLHDTELSYITLRVDYMVATHRPGKARQLALQALSHTGSRSDHQFSFHLTLARIAGRWGREIEALGHSLAARTHATRCDRQDLQLEADNLIYELTAGRSGLMQSVDQYLVDSVPPIAGELNSRN